MRSTIDKIERDIDIMSDSMFQEFENINSKLENLNEEFFTQIFKQVMKNFAKNKEAKYKKYFDDNFDKIFTGILQLKSLDRSLTQKSEEFYESEYGRSSINLHEDFSRMISSQN